MGNLNAMVPKVDDQFFDSMGLASLIFHRFLSDAARDIEILKPKFAEISSSDSPYAAKDNEYIVADMDGDITITLPSTGRVYLKREGASNTLTITGTVDGVTNPTVSGDGTVARYAYTGSEYKEF